MVLDCLELVLAENDMTSIDQNKMLQGTLLSYATSKKTGDNRIVVSNLLHGTEDMSAAIESVVSAPSRLARGFRIESPDANDINQEVFVVLDRVNHARETIGQVGPTKFNDESSRGHLFMILQAFHSKDNGGSAEPMDKPMTICDMAGFEDSATVLMGMLNHPTQSSSGPDSWERLARLPAGIIRRLAPDWEALTTLESIAHAEGDPNQEAPEIRIRGRYIMSRSGERMTRVASVVCRRAKRVLSILESRLSRRGRGLEGRCERSAVAGHELEMLALHFALISMRPVSTTDESPSPTVDESPSPTLRRPSVLRAKVKRHRVAYRV